ncbi:MAG: glycoside hydrolase family 3 N-terminal domain-containing protein, partial [Propionicimonas sp.]
MRHLLGRTPLRAHAWTGRPWLHAALATAVLALSAGCSPAVRPVPSGTVTTVAAPSRVASVTTSASADPEDAESEAPTPSEEPSEPVACLAEAQAMSLDARIGQLIMVGVTGGLDAAERKAITTHQLGSVVLLGDQSGGVEATAALAGELAALVPEAGMLLAADQEGGSVQRLTGPGFSRIPSAVKQAERPVESLQARAKQWGRELAEAGVQLNLAPVADVVPRAKVTTNAPIGRLRRGFGSDPEVVADKVRAVIAGYSASAVGTAAKHFPGLGEVVGNTDHASGVVDKVTSAESASLLPFRRAVETGVAAVMISSATYTKLDPKRQAVFSRTVIGLLRGWGYDGVVISDDLGAAASVGRVPASQRAVRFLDAGGDLVIDADPALVAPMVAGVRKKARQNAAFAEKITGSAARVLALKQELGIVACG